MAKGVTAQQEDVICCQTLVRGRDGEGVGGGGFISVIADDCQVFRTINKLMCINEMALSVPLLCCVQGSESGVTKAVFQLPNDTFDLVR